MFWKTKLPAPTAGPSEVRAYIAEVLVSQHDTSSELADEITSMWQLGRGSELRDASSKYFKGIFGNSNGWMLYRIVHEDILEDWHQSMIGMLSSYMLIGAFALATFLLIRVIFLYASNIPPSKGFKKATAHIFQAFLFLGVSLMTYGILTPSPNGVPISIGGSMLAVASAGGAISVLIPQVQGGGKTSLAGDR